ALEGAKFSVQLGFYGFARGFRGRVVGLYIKQTSIPEGLKRYTRFIAEIERYYRELPHIIKDINNARKLGLNHGYDIELQNRINMLKNLLEKAKNIRKNPKLPKEVYDYLDEIMSEWRRLIQEIKEIRKTFCATNIAS
ncbi:MAG: hypothetical protein N2513_10695, partial [Deltaproteobacteria bacterium]|nr:hypothetical protein [Deltaproteobacteria bacterium]